MKKISNNYEYNFKIINKFKNQLINVHKKYQKLLQQNNDLNRLNIFINKKSELLYLMSEQNNNNKIAFSYIVNDFINYLHKLNYKINREKIKLIKIRRHNNGKANKRNN